MRSSIFSYLDVKEQACAARVNRAWNKTATGLFLGAYLSYGRRFAVRSLTLKEPEITPFTLQGTSLYEIRDSVALLFPRDRLDAIIVHLESGKRQTIHLAQDRAILAASLLPSSRLVTITTDQRIRIWDCTNGSLLLTEEVSGRLVRDKVSIGEETIWMETGGRWEIFDTRTQLLENKERPRNIGRVIGFAANRLLSYEYDFVSIDTDDTTRVCSFEAVNVHESTVVWRTERLFGSAYDLKGCGVVGANEQIAVIAISFVYHFFGRKSHRIAFEILDAKTGEKIGHFLQDYSHLPNAAFMKEEGLLDCKKFSWLCGDFLAVWVGKELDIWHIPSQERFTRIHLENLCRPEELDHTHPHFSPIRHVEIQNKEIRVSLENLEKTELRWVKFMVNAPSDHRAIERIQAMPQRQMAKSCVTRAINRIRNLYKKLKSS